MKRIISIIIIIFIYVNAGVSKSGSKAGIFLTQDLSTRSRSLGGAFTGMSDDVSAMFYNPAGLTQIFGGEISLTHTESIEDIRRDSIKFAYSSGQFGFGLGLKLADYGDILGYNSTDITSALAETPSKFSSKEWVMNASFAMALRKKLSFGITGKFFNSDIENFSASSFSIDLGMLYEIIDETLKVGLSFQNIGSKLKYVSKEEELPLTFRTGFSYRFMSVSPAFLVGDLIYINGREIAGAAGLEYWPTHMFAFRGGVRTGAEAGQVSFGFGVNLSNLKFDYAFLPYGDFGQNHRITGTIKFGGIKKQASYSLIKVAEKKPELKMFRPEKRVINFLQFMDGLYQYPLPDQEEVEGFSSLNVELRTNDMDPLRVEILPIKVYSTLDKKGFDLQLVETAKNSNIFRNSFKLSSITDVNAKKIAAQAKDIIYIESENSDYKDTVIVTYPRIIKNPDELYFINENNIVFDQDYKAMIGDKIYIRAKAIDLNPKTIDYVYAKITSLENQKGIDIYLKQKTKDSEEYYSDWTIGYKNNDKERVLKSAAGSIIYLVDASGKVRDKLNVGIGYTGPYPIESLNFMNNDFTKELEDEDKVYVGSPLYIELKGNDNNPSLEDTAVVKLTSVQDAKGIKVILEETGEHTGIFRGIAFVKERSSSELNYIQARPGSTVIVAEDKNNNSDFVDISSKIKIIEGKGDEIKNGNK